MNQKVIEPISTKPPLLRPGPPSLELVDLEGAWEVLRTVRPRPIALSVPAGRVVLDADLLAEALLGAATAERILITATGPLEPVRLDFPDLRRTALVMPLPNGDADHDLGAHLRAAAEVATR